MPGVVEDPGHAEPRTKVARGLNLDGQDGPGAPPAGACKHENFESADGRKGTDSQSYRVKGCVPGWQGHKGFIVQFSNNQMHDGSSTMLIEVSGIDDERNDDSVDITWLYSKDAMTRDAAGKRILHDTSFRPTEEPEYTHYFSRTRGRIIDGVILSDVIENFELRGTRLSDARIRLEPQPDGTLKIARSASLGLIALVRPATLKGCGGSGSTCVDPETLSTSDMYTPSPIQSAAMIR